MTITFPDPLVIFGGTPGSAKWDSDRAHLRFVCPCGCGCLAGVNFKPIHPHGWNWDGNVERPTVTPSILIQPCGWHGFLTNGEWVKA